VIHFFTHTGFEQQSRSAQGGRWSRRGNQCSRSARGKLLVDIGGSREDSWGMFRPHQVAYLENHGARDDPVPSIVCHVEKSTEGACSQSRLLGSIMPGEAPLAFAANTSRFQVCFLTDSISALLQLTAH
jgi:hypothetical protein